MSSPSSYLIACPYCTEARNAAKTLSNLHRFSGSEVQVSARPSEMFGDDKWLGVRYLAVKCDHCHDSGHVPGPEAKAIIELIDWYVANYYDAIAASFDGKLARQQSADEESSQPSGGGING